MRNKVHTAIKLCKDCATKPVRAGGYCRACYYRHRYHENPIVRASMYRARKKWRENNIGKYKLIQHRWYMKNRKRLIEKVAGSEALRDDMYREFFKELRTTGVHQK